MELFVDIGTLLPVGTVVVAASPLMVPPSVSPSLPAHSIPIRRTPHNASALIAAAAATARTSPRLDACAAFFTGVPRHEPSVVASYSTDAAGGTGSGTGGGETKKKFLISASKQGEIVHWSYLPSVGYQPRALLIPPTTNVQLERGETCDYGQRRSYWMPSVAGSSLVNSLPSLSPRLAALTAALSCRVANKEVFVIADSAGCVSQWSIDGDCCYCAAKVCPFTITHLKVFSAVTQTASQHHSSHNAHTYAICASTQSNLIYIIDLLQMHVVRCIDITPEQADVDPLTDSIEDAPLGVACMDLHHVIDQDDSMTPARLESYQLIVVSTRGHLSVWDLTYVVHSTLHLSADPPLHTDHPTNPNSRRARSTSVSSAFFASLPPIDTAQSACISSAIDPLTCIASPIVSMSVYSPPPMPISHTSEPAAAASPCILLVMTHHWIIIDASTLVPIIPIQRLTPVTHDQQCTCGPGDTPTNITLMPLPPDPLSPTSANQAETSINSLPSLPDVPPLPSMATPTGSSRSRLNLPSVPPLPRSPSPNPYPSVSPVSHALAKVLAPCTPHCHTSSCCLSGGSFLSSSCPSRGPAILLWSRCGLVWVSVLEYSDRGTDTPPAATFQRTHSSPAAMRQTHPNESTHQPEATTRIVAILHSPSIGSDPSDPSSLLTVHVPSASGDLCAASPSPLLSILVTTRAGWIIEFEINENFIQQTDRIHRIKPTYANRMEDAFETTTFLERFKSHAATQPMQSDALLSSSIDATPIPTCTSMLFDLTAHPDFGLTSLLIMSVNGFADGRLESYKLLSSAIPQRRTSNQTAAREDHTHESEADTQVQAHDATITSIITFQSHESIFALPLLVTGSLDCSVGVWEARTSALVFRLRTPTPIVDLTRPILPPHAPLGSACLGSVSCIDREVVCVICADLSVRLFSIARMGWIQVLRGHDSRPHAVYRDEWCMANDIVFVLTARHTIYMWCLSSGQLDSVFAHDSPDAAFETIAQLPIFGGGTALQRTSNSTRPSPSSHTRTRSMHSPNTTPNQSESNSPALGIKSLSLNSSPHARSKSIAPGGSLPSPPLPPLADISEVSIAPLPSRSVGGRFSSSLAPSTPSRSPPPPAPAHSTSRFTQPNNNQEDLLTPPKMNRATTAPTQLRPTLQVSPSPPAPAPTGSSLPGLKTASWAVHYGLQRLWKLGGKGGLWSTAPDVAQNALGSDVTASVASAASASNLICSFESMPNMKLNLLSIDIGYFTAEIKHSYAPLDATSDTRHTHANSHATNLDTKHRAEVYKEVLKLVMDWDDAYDSESSASSSSSLSAGVIDILVRHFHMRPPHSARSSVGPTMPPCFACYSPTNNAVTILLPSTCSTQAKARMAARAPAIAPTVPLAHLARWSIGPNFTASQSLCLTTVLMALLGSSDIALHNHYSFIEAFYNGTLPTMQREHALQSMEADALSSAGVTSGVNLWHYTEADIPFLSSYALHEHEDIRRGSRLLIQGLIGRMVLSDLWVSSREWSSFYENIGSTTPPPLPFIDTNMTKNAFPAPPRMVSDFEFMTCMILCYLYQAQAKRVREAKAASNSAPQRRIDRGSSLAAASSSSSSVSRPRVDSDGHAPESVISLDASMFGLSIGLKVEPSPKHQRRQPATDEKKDEESTQRSTPANAPIVATPPADKTAWIMSTLLRLLAQTHQDETLHSIQKSSICVELLIQGLTQASRSGTNDDSDLTNHFWKFIPVSALEPLYRIIFDLSFLPPTSDPTPNNAHARRGSEDDIHKPVVATPQQAFANNSRVLLFELAKWDMPHFIEWVRKEIFGYAPGFATAGDPHDATAKHAQPVDAFAASNSAPPALSLSSSAYASYKSRYFDEYRFQLVSVLAAMPKKFAARMNYGVIKCMVDVFIRVLDPMMPAQNQVGQPPPGTLPPNASSHPHSTPLGGGFLPLRGRLFTLLHPLFQFMSLKYTWLGFSRDTLKLAVVENLRWIAYERCGLGFYKMQDTEKPNQNGADDTNTHDTQRQEEQHYLMAQPPVIHIYDLQTSLKWRTLEGHAAGSEIDCIAFSPNGHLLASYCSTDLPSPTMRIWSTDYESSSVGSGFFPTRLLMKTIFKVNPFCIHVVDLPKLPLAATQTRMQQRREHMLDMHGFITQSGIVWHHAEALTLGREDDSTHEFKL